MNNYPEYAEVNGKKYKINTDFRVAIKCNEIAQDENIDNVERAMAIIYLLYGDDGLNADNDEISKLLEIAKKYLSCGKEIKDTNEKPDMDFVEDYDYISASFQSDYSISLDDTNMHWWKFNNLINGLSNSELGNCCVLNRIRNIRNYDTSKIKDAKELEKINKAKQQFALHKNKKVEEVKLTAEQEKSANDLFKSLGF